MARCFPSTARLAWRWMRVRVLAGWRRGAAENELETAFCAEVLGVTYEAMGCCRPGAGRSGMTPGASGAATGSPWPRALARRGDRGADSPPNVRLTGARLVRSPQVRPAIASAGSAGEVGQHGEDAAMVIVTGRQAELVVDVRDEAHDGLLGNR